MGHGFAQGLSCEAAEEGNLERRPPASWQRARRLLALILCLAAVCTPAVSGPVPGNGYATAFVVNADGYLLTCAHAVRGATHVSVVIDNRVYAATVVAADERHDLALLRVEARNLPVVPLGDSDAVELGQEVRGFGFPLALRAGENLTVTRGTVSHIENRCGTKVFRTDAQMNPGNSGGPVINEGTGEVIGVHYGTFVPWVAPLPGGIPRAVGPALAVPINYAKALLRSRGVTFTVLGTKERLDGPQLVRRVGPAVAQVVATIPQGRPPVAAYPAPQPPAPRTPVNPGPLLGAPRGPVRALKAHAGPVFALAFSLDGRLLASGGEDRGVRLWDTATGVLKQALTAPPELIGNPSVASVAFSPDGAMLAAGPGPLGKAARLWDVRSGRLVRVFARPFGEPWGMSCVAFAPDGKTLVTAGGRTDPVIRVWDVETGALRQALGRQDDPFGSVTAMAFGLDALRLVSVHSRGLRRWDLRTGALEDEQRLGNGDQPEAFALSPDAKAYAFYWWPAGVFEVGRVDTRAVLLPQAPQGGPLGRLDPVRAIAFSPTGRWVAAGMRARPDAVSACVWDARTGSLCHRFVGQGGAVYALAFSPDGALLATGGHDGSVCLWDVSEEMLSRPNNRLCQPRD